MPKTQLIEEKLTGSAVGAFYDVYNNLGFGQTGYNDKIHY